ncbi:MAG: primosomal protein N' [Candidatus Marinimicrobia bacterium]|nr:primosomal protein N' [Candidatus Neomarinimicrobiota bacterium]
MYCSIAFPNNVYKTFTYSVPEGMREDLRPGMRVKAPFGARSQIGYCVKCFSSLPGTSSYTIKAIEGVPDRKPLFTRALIRLITWISEYYMAPPGICFRAAHPSELGYKRVEYCFVSPEEDSGNWPEIPATGLSTLAFFDLPETRRKAVKQGLDSGVLYIDNIFPKAKRSRRVTAVRLLETDAKVSERQQEVVDLLSSLDQPLEAISMIRKKLRVSVSVINTLIKNGVLEKCEMEVPADPFDHLPSERRRDVRLSAEQKRVIDEIVRHENRFYPVLLHGITGSGKTEIYIQLAKRQLEQRKSVLILVPEIAITPQIAARFRSAFGGDVAIWHSQMSDAERLWTWNQMLLGTIRLVVGARSALFAPIPDIGLIVVDEEQESSFKQDDPAPRYHARDAAVMYAHILKVPVILGSATPSLESYYQSALHRYRRMELKERFGGARLPRVSLIDMNTAERRGIFSEKLLEAVWRTVEKGKQAIILQNRRGFNTVFVCSECGKVLQCPKCSVSLTYHKRLDKLMCHVCNAGYPVTKTCPDCGRNTLKPAGSGTQRIEDELQTFFPDARIARMDLDTTRTRHAHARILTEFEAHRHDILLGTQMIAKGLDFPDVTLVGIINADTGIGIPDYRAGERLFQLIYQVSGRSGRGRHPGTCLFRPILPTSRSFRWLPGFSCVNITTWSFSSGRPCTIRPSAGSS